MLLAYEKLVNSRRMSAIIREDRICQIRTLFQQGTEDFQSLDYMLGHLCRDGKIAKDTAFKLCENRGFIMETINAGRK